MLSRVKKLSPQLGTNQFYNQVGLFLHFKGWDGGGGGVDKLKSCSFHKGRKSAQTLTNREK